MQVRRPEDPPSHLQDAVLGLDRAGRKVQAPPRRQATGLTDALQHGGRELCTGRSAGMSVREPPGDLGDLVGDPRDVADDDVGCLSPDRLEEVPHAELDPLVQGQPPCVLLGNLDGIGGEVASDHSPRPQPGGHEREHPAPAAHVDDGLPLSDVERLGDRPAGVRAFLSPPKACAKK